MARHNLASLEKRLEALEQKHDRPEIWITRVDDDPQGWEVVPGNGECGIVMRQESESNDDLKARARAKMRELCGKGGPLNTVALYFGLDKHGVTL